MLLCFRCAHEHPLDDREVSFRLYISEKEWLKTKSVLLAKNLIDKENRPIAWEKRQFINDQSIDRTARYRERRKKMGLKGQEWIPAKVRAAIFERDGEKCVYCGERDVLTIDHRTPTVRGGDDSDANLQSCCRLCNSDKRNMTHEEYVNWAGRRTLVTSPKELDTHLVDASDSTRYRLQIQNQNQSTEKQNTTRTRQKAPSIGSLHFTGQRLKITIEEHQALSLAFEGADFGTEYLKMDSWLVTNHRNYRAFGRFANGWLSRQKLPNTGAANGNSGFKRADEVTAEDHLDKFRRNAVLLGLHPGKPS
jgi:5-methylcytosine-specific restriction endonuclease McrA